jgi:N-formylglutamate amidohydrolase
MPGRERAKPQQTDALDPPFSVARPLEQTAPFVVCSPHSGRHYTRTFLDQSRLDPLTLRRSEDYCIDELYAAAVDLGAPMLHAHFPRAYLDANREPYELDPDLFDDVLPDYANTQSVRVIGGLGTIARIVSDGEEIYKKQLKLDDALHRINTLYVPFHECLQSLLEETRQKFGYAILLDCHSMPSSQLKSSGSARPEFVLGDRFGHSCDGKLTRFLREAISNSGYDVQLNRPYAGGYITEHYGRPHRGIHAIQIEINRGLYMDETDIRPNQGFERLRANLRDIISRTFAEVPVLFERRAAAE